MSESPSAPSLNGDTCTPPEVEVPPHPTACPEGTGSAQDPVGKLSDELAERQRAVAAEKAEAARKADALAGQERVAKELAAVGEAVTKAVDAHAAGAETRAEAEKDLEHYLHCLELDDCDCVDAIVDYFDDAIAQTRDYVAHLVWLVAHAVLDVERATAKETAAKAALDALLAQADTGLAGAAPLRKELDAAIKAEDHCLASTYRLALEELLDSLMSTEDYTAALKDAVDQLANAKDETIAARKTVAEHQAALTEWQATLTDAASDRWATIRKMVTRCCGEQESEDHGDETEHDDSVEVPPPSPPAPADEANLGMS